MIPDDDASGARTRQARPDRGCGVALPWVALALVAAVALPREAAAAREVHSLAGIWGYAVAGAEAVPPPALADRIELPGTTVSRSKGERLERGHANGWGDSHVSPARAWYQREIAIPAEWAGRRVVLFLERTRASRVWVGDREMPGVAQTLSTPHVYDLSGLPAGRHQLTIGVDAAAVSPIKSGHEAVLQGPWNGIVGRIELQVTDSVWIDRIRLTPDRTAGATRAEVFIGNRTGRPQSGVVTLAARSRNTTLPHVTEKREAPFAVPPDGGVVQVDLPMGDGAPAWDEFHPALFELEATLAAAGFEDRHREVFGFREFRREGRRLLVNGRPVFLRGTHDGAVFPITGHPPMTADGWRRYFTQLRDWGFNHVRFHSWCPPAAAFEVADELGLYLQPEVHWFGVNPAAPEQEAYGLQVAAQLTDWYGNHPSFCLISFGNEGRGGSLETMTRMLEQAKRHDPRHLWSNITNNQSDWGYTAQDDFFSSYGSRRPDGSSRPARGANSYPEALGRGSHITFGPPGTLADFAESVADTPVPMISHETGQFQIYPNYDEIPKYTGVKRPFNLAILRERLERAGMGDQWRDFFRASAALAAINYREDIEASLRTPQFGGFQLLDIKDYPGQGTALVGLWGVFLDPKGALTREQWREFCSETVPLLRFEKYTWRQEEEFTARVQVAHYGAADRSGRASWVLRRMDGTPLRSGRIEPIALRTGAVNDVGEIRIQIADLPAPGQFEVVVQLEGTPFRNRWPLWVYPAARPAETPPGVMVARRFDAAVQSALRQGGRVLLYPRAEDLPHTVKGLFQSDYWCFSMFNRHAVWSRGIGLPPGTLGMLTDPSHPIFRSFPTDFHADYQWWHLIDQARVMVLDDAPGNFRPIVQMIDNVVRNHRLGIVWEARAGAGRLLVCSSPLPDLAARFPEADQLHRALLAYAASDRFAPAQEMSAAVLRRMLLPIPHLARRARATGSSQYNADHPAERAVDGRLDTYWLAQSNTPTVKGETVIEGKLVTAPAGARGPEWLRLDFPQPIDATRVRLHWLSDAFYPYRIEGTTDGQTWRTLADQSRNTLRQIAHELTIAGVGLRALRIECGPAALGKPALREVEVW